MEIPLQFKVVGGYLLCALVWGIPECLATFGLLLVLKKLLKQSEHANPSGLVVLT